MTRNKQINVNVLIVDDDDMTRDGLVALLSVHDHMVVREASDGFLALESYKNALPDVVLLDLKMPYMNGIETMRKMKQINRTVPIVMMTAYGDIPTAVEAMKYGAYDFIVKPPNPDALVQSLTEAADGRFQKSDGARDVSLELDAELKSYFEKYESLTPREREIFALTVQGLTSSQIGQRLTISNRTVESHRENMMSKLNLRNKHEMILFAMRLGLLR